MATSPASEKPVPPRKERVHRFMRPLLLVAVTAFAVIATAAAGVWVFRDTLAGPRLRVFLERALADTSGMTVEVGPISGSYIGGLDVAYLRLTAVTSDAPLQRLTTGTVRVRYSPLRLLAGVAAFTRHATATIADARVDFSLGGAGSPSAPSSAPPAWLAVMKNLPPLPSVSLTNTTVTAAGTGGSGSMVITGIRFADVGGRALRLDVDAAGGTWVTAADTVTIPTLAFSLTATDHGLHLNPLTVGDGLLTADARLDLARVPDIARFKITGALAGAPTTVTGAYEGNRIAMDFNVNGVDIGAALARSGLGLREPVSGILDVDGECNWPMDFPARVQGNLTLTVTDGVFGRVRISRGTVDLSSDGQTLQVIRAELESPGNLLNIDGLRLPQGLFEGNALEALAAAEGRFTLSGSNAAALLGTVTTDAAKLPDHDYRLSGALSGGILSLAEGRLSAGGGALRILPSSVTLPRPLAATDTAVIDIHGGVDFPELLPLSRILSLPVPLSGWLRGQVAVTGPIGSLQGQLAITAGALRLDDRSLGGLRLSGSVADGLLDIRSLDWQNGGDHIHAAGRVHIGRRQAQGVSVDFTATDPMGYIPAVHTEKIPAVFRRLDLKGSASGTMGIDGPLVAPRISLNARIRNLRAGDQPLGGLAVKAEIDGRRIHIERALLINGKDRVLLTGGFDAGKMRFDAVRAEISLADIAPYRHLVAGPLPPLGGDFRATVSASGDLMAPDARLAASSTSLETPAGTLTSLKIKAHATPDRRLLISELTARMSDTLLTAAGTLDWSPDLNAATLRLNALSADRNGVDLGLTSPATAVFGTDGRLSLTQLTLTGSAGTLTLTGSLDPSGAVTATALISKLDGTGWLPDITGGRLDVSGLDAAFTVSGTRDAPIISFSATADTVSSPLLPMPLTGQLQLEYAAARLAIRRFEWSHSDGSRIRISGDVPFRVRWQDIRPTAPVTLEAEVAMPQATALNTLLDKSRITAGSLSASATITGTWGAPEGMARVTGDGVMIDVGQLPLPPGPLGFSAKAGYSGRTIVVDNFRLSAPAVVATGAGSWKNINPPWLPTRIADSDDAVSLDATVSADRLDWVAAAVPGVRVIDGQLVTNVHLRGAPSRPEVTATLSIRDAQVRAEGRLPAVEAINLQAALADGNLTVANFNALIGAAPLTGSGGISGLFSPDPAIDLRFTGDNLLLYRDPGLRVRGDTSLALTGPLSRMQLNGNVVVTDGLFSRPVDILGSLRARNRPKRNDRGIHLFSIREPPLRDMELDVAISAANPFIIRSNLVRGKLTPRLRLTGTAEVPLLVGKVLVTTARLSLPSGKMTIENGLVQFPDADPERPVIDLQGTSRIFGYDVRLIAEGAYDTPVITLSSTPPLASEDILLMLLTGVPPSTGFAESGIRRRSLNVTMFIGQDLISKWFDNGDSDNAESVLERFDVQWGREITQKGEETVEAQFRLADNVFRKGGTIYLTAEKDAYDYYNAGVRFVFRLR